MKRITKEEFISYAGDKLNEFNLVGEYCGWGVDTEFRHVPCDHVFKTTPASICRGLKCCPKCKGKVVGETQRIKLPQFQQMLAECLPRIEVVPETFVTVQDMATFRHIKCGQIFEALPTVLINNYIDDEECPKCRINKQARPYEQVKSDIDAVDGYKLVSSTYQSMGTPLEILHEKCGKTFNMDFNHFYYRKQR